MSGGFDNTDDLPGESRNLTVKTDDGFFPVTIKEIHIAETKNNNLCLNDKILNQVTICGQITAVSSDSFNQLLTINDSTGSLNVQIFDTDPSCELSEGMYIFAAGRLTVLDGNISLHIYGFQVVTDFNQIAFHLSQALFCYLHHQRGLPPKSVFAQAVKQTNSSSTNSTTSPNPSSSPKTNIVQSSENLAEQINSFLIQGDRTTGTPKDEIIKKFSGRYSVSDIESAIDSMSVRGEIYVDGSNYFII